jgi:hypothetical protein
VNWIHGRHSFTFGGNYFRKGEYDWDFIRFVSFGEGSYPGSAQTTPFTASGSDIGSVGGNALADLMVGAPTVIHQRFDFAGGKDPLAPELNVVFPSWGAYVNDKIQISPRLTVTVGLRYDLNIPLFARNNLCCAVYQPNSSGGQLAIPGIASGLSQKYLSPQKTNFAPRFSFAYQFDPKTVIRAGYGIYYDSGASQVSGSLGNALNGIPGYFIGGELTNSGALPTYPLADTFQTPAPLAAGEYPVSTGTGQGYFGDGAFQNVYYYDQKSIATPYYQRYLLDVQHEFGANSVFTLTYEGAQGRKSPYYADLNVPAYRTGWSTGDAFNAARPNNAGRFGEIFVQRPGLNSNYNAGIAKFEHRFSHGFQVLTHYTFSKTISDRGLTGQGTVLGFDYPQQILSNRGEASLSHRHRVLISTMWEPSYGKSWAPPLKAIATGWRISAIGTMESGDALTPINYATSSNDFASAVSSFEQLNQNGNPNLGHFDRTFTQFFDVKAFSAPPNGVRGNAGVGTIRGPGQNNWDLSFAKGFQFFERAHADFRADMFNAFNHTQWNAVSVGYPFDPNTNIPFGQVEGAREGRIIQLAVKLSF